MAKKSGEYLVPLRESVLAVWTAHGYFSGMSFLEKNLAAIAEYSPVTAALVTAATIPQGFVLTAGTDGTQTFLRQAAEHLEWLGETSMPAASAAPLVAGLDAGGANGLGVSIGTGFEWLAFVKRLARAQALFVYEPDAGLLRMALTICDLSSPLEEARIVLLGGTPASASSELADFLASHLGHESPTVLHPLPTLTGERRNTLLAAGESIVRHAVQARQGAVNQLSVEMAALTGASGTVGLLATERYVTERPLHEILGAGVPRIYVDRHASASVALRAKLLLTHRPAEVVSDFFRPELGCVPPTIPVVTWIPPLVGPGFWQNRVPAVYALAPDDRVVVQAHVHQLLLESLGIPRGQIELRPLRRAPLAAASAAAHGTPRVALIADLPRSDAGSLGVQLPTHQAVHAAASALIIDDYLTVSFDNAADILRRALARASVSPSAADSDPGLKDQMLRLVRDTLIPALPPLTLARTLFNQGIALRLIDDWPNLDLPGAETARLTIESFHEFFALADRWQDTAAVVHLSPCGTVSPIILQAAAANVSIIACRHATDSFPGALPALLETMTRPTPQQLIQVIKSVVRSRKV